jgi:acyl-CoA synthetase (AMP-forming)/AMP-acid ligase II
VRSSQQWWWSNPVRDSTSTRCGITSPPRVWRKQKVPERLVLVDELPRTSLGKVRKAELRAKHFSGGSAH